MLSCLLLLLIFLGHNTQAYPPMPEAVCCSGFYDEGATAHDLIHSDSSRTASIVDYY